MASNGETTPSAASWEDLADHVRNELLPGSPSVLKTTPLISSGLLDSYSVVELIAHVERRFDIKVAPCWYRLEHLDSLERIVETIEKIRCVKPS